MAAVNLRSNALNVLITGANRGIGLSLAKQFHNNGYNVIGTSRNTDAATIADLSAVTVAVVPLDVADEASISALPDRVRAYVPHLDVVVNNAGMYLQDKFGALNATDLLTQFRVNSVAPLLVAQALLPTLRASPNAAKKIVHITSRMGSIADNTSGGSYGYRASKCALNMLNASLAQDVKDVTCIALHPGYIQTRMTSGSGEMDADECAKRLFKVIHEATPAQTGQFLHRDGQVLPW
ncbi:hypothetical protein GGF31_002380 [Allomyces arbusculus]|nr:hypothetical protein GGF31_002380 [Allomyces arbusculus]